LREAAHGERVYMRVGDIFKDADVVDLSGRRELDSAAIDRALFGGCARAQANIPMSALLPKADIAERDQDVRFVPKADIEARSNVLGV
jgi:hypothetical protein